jgi:hypothetical protein
MLEIYQRYNYTGDRDIANGGIFFDLSTFNDGYVDAVRVENCGDYEGDLYGVVRIEHISINGTTDRARIKTAMRGAMGWESFRRLKGKYCRQLAICEALLCYGYYDDDSWDNYRSGTIEYILTSSDIPDNLPLDVACSQIDPDDTLEYIERTHINMVYLNPLYIDFIDRFNKFIPTNLGDKFDTLYEWLLTYSPVAQSLWGAEAIDEAMHATGLAGLWKNF